MLTYLKTQTQDGYVFTGQLFTKGEGNAEASNSMKSHSDTVVLHIHGMGGNLYFNSFYPEMVKQYTQAGIDLLIVEHRGSASVNGVYNAKKDKVELLGNAYEIFEDSVYDINAWIKKLLELGYKNIILQGHSLGPSKIMYWYFNERGSKQIEEYKKYVKALVLLSPVDMLGLTTPEPNYKQLLNEAKNLVKQGKGKALLSKLLWAEYLLSAETFLSLFSPDAKANIFAYHDTEAKVWQQFVKVNIPVFLAAGTKDEFENPQANLQMLKDALINSPNVTVKLYKGANHDFEGFGEELARDVVGFVETNVRR